MKVSTEYDNNFGYEKITILVENMPLKFRFIIIDWLTRIVSRTCDERHGLIQSQQWKVGQQ